MPQLRDLMTKNPQFVTPNATLAQAAERMNKLNCGAIPVVENGAVKGIVTDRDIVVKAIAQHKNPEQEQVHNFMSNSVLCCYEDQDIHEAAKLMETKQVRRIPVLTRTNQLIGIVSLGDLAIQTHNQQLGGEVLEKVSETRRVSAA